MSYNGILGIHDLVVHDYGPGRVFASVHAEVDAHGNLMESHDLIDNIEKEVGTEMKMFLVIHMDPVDTQDPLTQIVKAQLTEVIQAIPEILSVHDVRVVPGVTHHNILFDIVVAAGTEASDTLVKAKVTALLKEYNPMYNTVIEVDRNYAGEVHN